MATMKNGKVANNSAAVSTRSFNDVCEQIMTIEEFCEKVGAKSISVVKNPLKVNLKTREANIFFTAGTTTGAVAQKVQEKILKNEELGELVIGKMFDDKGNLIWTLFEQGANDNVLFTIG